MKYKRIIIIICIIILIILGIRYLVYNKNKKNKYTIDLETQQLTLKKPISAQVLLKQDPKILKETYGFKIIHQVWVDKDNENGYQIPQDHEHYFKSWKQYHPNALHVIWNQKDNRDLLRLYYPEYLNLYDSLLLPVQKADMIRLLHLYHYGGIYADLDYEAHRNIFNHLPSESTNSDLLIVRSPILLNEVMQNSLMISKTIKHSYWLECIKSIDKIIYFIQHKHECFENSWGGCNYLNLFHHPISKETVNLLYTMQITGPAILDKTYVLHKHKQWKIFFLPIKLFFTGKNDIDKGVSTHHQKNTWVNVTNIISKKSFYQDLFFYYIHIGIIFLLCIFSILILLIIKKNFFLKDKK